MGKVPVVRRVGISRPTGGMWGVLLLFCLPLSFFLSQAFGQSPSDAGRESKAWNEVLPPSSEAPRRVIVSETTALRELFPLEFQGVWTEENKWMFVWREPPFKLRADDRWVAGSAEAFENYPPEQGAFVSAAMKKEGALYGDSRVLAKLPESSRAPRTLWSMQSRWWKPGVLQAALELRFEDQRGFPPARAEYLRVYSHNVFPDDKGIQLFRERLTWRTPAFLDGQTMLTYRFPGETRDRLWVHSAAIRQTRQITDSNRSDGIFGSPFSLSDLFTWSDKIEMVEARFVREQELLMPFPEKSMLRFYRQPSSSCNIVSPAYRREKLRYAPRTFWRFVILTQDPFSLYGRQVLYLEKDSLLPVYKAVFDRDGKLWKTVETGYAMAFSENRAVRRPVPVFTSVTDVQSGQRALLRYEEVRFCDNLPKGIDAKYFHPALLAPKGAEKE